MFPPLLFLLFQILNFASLLLFILSLLGDELSLAVACPMVLLIPRSKLTTITLLVDYRTIDFSLSHSEKTAPKKKKAKKITKVYTPSF